MNAKYHQADGSVTLEVIGRVKDGKADLGKGKDIYVAAVPVVEDGSQPGTCVLIEEDDPKAALKAAAKAAHQKASAAAKAADAAKGKPEHEELVKAAEDAAETARQAAEKAEAAA